MRDRLRVSTGVVEKSSSPIHSTETLTVIEIDSHTVKIIYFLLIRDQYSQYNDSTH